MEDKNPVGRPTDYDPKYCKMLIKHMEKGFSFESFGADVDCGRATLYRWEKEHEEFRDAKKIGHEKAFKKLEMAGLGMAFGKTKGNSTAWLFTMKNRFGWRDTHVIEFEGEVEYNPEDQFSRKHLETDEPQTT